VISRASRGDWKREIAYYRMFFPKLASFMKRLTTEWIATADEDHLLVVELGCSPKLMSCDLIFFTAIPQPEGNAFLKAISQRDNGGT
jgi:hypothetical protein